MEMESRSSAKLLDQLRQELTDIRDEQAVLEIYRRACRLEPPYLAESACRTALRHTIAPSPELLNLVCQSQGKSLATRLCALAGNPCLSQELAEDIGVFVLEWFNDIVGKAFNSLPGLDSSRPTINSEDLEIIIRPADTLGPLETLYRLDALSVVGRTTRELRRQLLRLTRGWKDQRLTTYQVRAIGKLLLKVLVLCESLDGQFFYELLDDIGDWVPDTCLEDIVLHPKADPRVWFRVFEIVKARNLDGFALVFAQIPNARIITDIRSWIAEHADSDEIVLFHLCKDPDPNFSVWFKKLSERSPYDALALLDHPEFKAASQLTSADFSALLMCQDRDVRLEAIQMFASLKERAKSPAREEESQSADEQAIETWRDRYISPILPF